MLSTFVAANSRNVGLCPVVDRAGECDPAAVRRVKRRVAVVGESDALASGEVDALDDSVVLVYNTETIRCERHDRLPVKFLMPQLRGRARTQIDLVHRRVPGLSRNSPYVAGLDENRRAIGRPSGAGHEDRGQGALRRHHPRAIQVVLLPPIGTDGCKTAALVPPVYRSAFRNKCDRAAWPPYRLMEFGRAVRDPMQPLALTVHQEDVGPVQQRIESFEGDQSTTP